LHLAFQSSSQVPVLRLSIDYVVFATLTRMAMFKSGITVVIVIYSMVMSEGIPSCLLLELSLLSPFLDSIANSVQKIQKNPSTLNFPWCCRVSLSFEKLGK